MEFRYTHAALLSLRPRNQTSILSSGFRMASLRTWGIVSFTKKEWARIRTSFSLLLSSGSLSLLMTRVSSSRSSMMKSLRSESILTMMVLMDSSHWTRTPVDESANRLEALMAAAFLQTGESSWHGGEVWGLRQDGGQHGRGTSQSSGHGGGWCDDQKVVMML